MAMEDIGSIRQQFDLVTSSLAFDYIEDFGGLMSNIYLLMADDAKLVFSMSHPMVTAWDGSCDRYTRTESGERLHANVVNYCVDGYECYHRTLATLINDMIKAGFNIEECQESHISDDMRKQYPDLFGGTIHRPEFIFFKCGKR